MFTRRTSSSSRTSLSTAWLATLLLCMSCALQPQDSDTLYRRLGGEPGIARIVDGLLVNIAADHRIRHHFESLHLAGFRQRLAIHFCDITGGPCTFDGRSMRESHRLLDISQADFNALVEDLIDAMDSIGVQHQLQNEFLARLAPMQPDIVVRSGDATGGKRDPQ